MTYQPYLLFQLAGGQYGITAHVVQELFLLPALTSIAEATAETVGILNLRGHVIPVIDLKSRLGKPQQPYQLTHVVLLITVQHQSVGIIVDAVQTVEFIAEAELAVDVSSHLVTQAEHALTAGLAKHNSQLITLLNPNALIAGTSILQSPPAPGVHAIAESHEFLASFTEAEQAVLTHRADALMVKSENEGLSGLMALAIVGMQGERFALGLEAIQEFTDISKITPIPCCPSHIVGNMNLRGEILTLVDIRQCVNLDHATPTNQRQAVIVRVDEIVAGIVVDDVFDVMYIHPNDIASVPTATHSADNEYIRGVIQAEQSLMSILDLPKLLTHGELVVDQAA